MHSTQFISGHYFLRYFNQNTNALGVIVDRRKWDGATAEKADFFAPYALPAEYQFEFYNGLSRVQPQHPFYFSPRKVFPLDNILLMDILDPTPEQLQEFEKIVSTTR